MDYNNFSYIARKVFGDKFKEHRHEIDIAYFDKFRGRRNARESEARKYLEEMFSERYGRKQPRISFG